MVSAIGLRFAVHIGIRSVETTPPSNQQGTLLLAVTVARYRSIVLLLHHQRLAQTGTRVNNCQERQADDARACRLVINRRNVILTAPGMQAGL